MIHEFYNICIAGHAVWLLAAFSAVTLAMAADLASGVAKSRRLKRPINSRGLKQTCDKAMKYFLPMLCLSCIDILASVILPVPALTMVFAAYCIFCEIKSILETTEQKADILSAIREAERMALLRPEVADALKSLIKKSKSEKHENNQ